MRLNLVTLCLACLIFAGFNVNAQRNCSSMEVLEAQLQQDPKRAAKMESIENFTRNYINNNTERITGIITIPIVFHVIYNNSAENLSDAQLMSQLAVLNEDFRRTNSDANGTWGQAADTEIEFCLATVDPNGNPTTGITRTSTSTTSWGANDAMKFTSSGGIDAWPASDYLNFWICDLSGGLLGYAQFPGGNPATDGVVNDYAYTGSGGSAQAPFDLGRTATHEVGHWLNLRHIWGDGGCTVDDFVSDTPLSDASNGGCATGHVSCGSTDMVENYMDYSDDACMNLFTAGQTARMRALFDPGGARESILSSSACGSGNPPTCTDGFQNGQETGVDCGGPDCPDCPTCSDGILNGQETGVDCGGPDCNACPCTGTNVTVTINLDNYPEETSWQLTDAQGAVVGSGGTYGSQPDGSTVTADFCLNTGCYDFTIFDTYGDGICCSYGTGSYDVSDDNGNVLASGGSFGSSETTNFCVGGTTAPTCTDGIQNGQETDVDCGGPDCPACPTCTDGILNGQETDVDCGGPDCPACPTCTDEIQNGQETGVDCGGPDCAPCNTGGCTYTTINFNNFESGLGIWNDGGSDCRRSWRDAQYANSGTYCVRLRDNTGSSVLTTDVLNLSAYDELTVDFSYITVSMDNSNEDFWLQLSTDGGATYTIVEEWNLNDEFVNNSRESGNAVIPGPFTSNCRLRFRCDASANNDLVYIDDVNIDGCVNSNREELILPEAATELARNPGNESLIEAVSLTEFLLYPNPTSDQLTVDFTLAKANQVDLRVTDFTGKTIEMQRLQGILGQQQTTLDASQFSSGFYFVHLITDGKITSKKFVVTH